MRERSECPVCVGNGFITTVPEPEVETRVLPPRPSPSRRKNVLVPKDAWQLAHVLLDYYGDPGLVAQAFEGLADFRSQHLARFEWMTIASRYREAGTVGSQA